MNTTCQRVRELAPGYVLGALDQAEMRAVREHLETCKNPHPEMRELGGVVPYLAVALEPIEPSAALKGAILAAAQTDVNARQRSDQAAERLVATLGSAAGGRRRSLPGPEPAGEHEIAPRPVPEPLPVQPERETEPARVVPISRRRRILPWIAATAAVLVLAVGVGAYVGEQAARPQQGANAEASEYYHLFQGATYTVYLHAPNGQDAHGIVARMPSGNLFVTLSALPETSGTEVYEVWLVAPSGQKFPVAGAGSQGGRATFGEISSPAVDTAKQLIVTREPAPNPVAASGPVIVSGDLPN